MTTPLHRFRNITKAIDQDFYKELALVELMEDSDLENMKIKVIPNEGIHKAKEYIITIKFNGVAEWPYIFIDSEIYDKIKTSQYLENRGKAGEHKGICIKHLGYAYAFTKHFKQLCDNKWEVYVYYLITVFNNLQDFERGNGLKSNYKKILKIEN